MKGQQPPPLPTATVRAVLRGRLWPLFRKVWDRRRQTIANRLMTAHLLRWMVHR